MLDHAVLLLCDVISPASSAAVNTRGKQRDTIPQSVAPVNPGSELSLDLQLSLDSF